jgi:AraC family transcriptional regulator, activator of mtrCDE
MDDYNKIIESLSVRFIKSRNLKVLNPFYVENFYDVENVVALVHKGEIYFGDEREKVSETEILFIPAGKNVNLNYGPKNNNKISNEEYLSNREKYVGLNSNPERVGMDENSFTAISFDAKVFDSVNFFTSLDLPPFVIKGNDKLRALILQTIREDLNHKIGTERLIKNYTEQIVIEVIRHIIEHRLFVEQLATNGAYFKDPRLIDIFMYIKDNIAGDLSNQVLAKVASVSEDYVGQYFKMLTGINPQDYIEYQRMEAAVNLLRTSKDSIRDIGAQVGYKDTAYFCRRFKMMFGIPAGKMRRRESLINI